MTREFLEQPEPSLENHWHDASGKEGQFSDSDKKTAENFGIDYMDVNDFVNYL